MCPGVDFRTLLHIWVKLFCFAIIVSSGNETHLLWLQGKQFTQCNKMADQNRVCNWKSKHLWDAKANLWTHEAKVHCMAKDKCHAHKSEANGSKVEGFDYLNDFGLEWSNRLLKNPKSSLSMLTGNVTWRVAIINWVVENRASVINIFYLLPLLFRKWNTISFWNSALLVLWNSKSWLDNPWNLP